jgi:AraC-like DNA-binding protein
MHGSLEGRLTLKEISHDVSRQPEYLGWLFHRETGQTFHARLTTLRLRRAAQLIRRGEKIEAVVLLVGYRSKRSFYEHFRRLFHMTPGEYRVQADALRAATSAAITRLPAGAPARARPSAPARARTTLVDLTFPAASRRRRCC